MQPMPAKTRTAMVVGILVLAVAVGSIAFWSTRRNAAQSAPDPYTMTTTDPTADLFTMPGEPTRTATLPTEAGQAASDPNAAGTAAAATSAIPTTTPARVPAEHVVAPGDTLSSISRTYYATPIYAGDIEALNQLTDPDLLKVGDVLKLPQPESLPVFGN